MPGRIAPMSDSVDTRPFFFRGGGVGCLLIHGFSGTPYEMRFLGEQLHGVGFTVCGVRLAGHATTGPEAVRSGRDQWYAAAREGLSELSRQCRRTFVVGLSMGSLLGLSLAREYPLRIHGLVLMGTALVLEDHRLRRAAPLLRVLAAALPQRWQFLAKGPSDILDPEARRIHPRFPMPLRGLAELVALQRECLDRLPAVRQPALLLHGRRDRTCKLESLEIARTRIGSPVVHTRIFENSAHIITVDRERQEVAAETIRFLEGIEAPAAPQAATG